ncbi:MAG TPA: hypothetical protein VIS06_08755, partial [Mycobacteriales bacterium]
MNDTVIATVGGQTNGRCGGGLLAAALVGAPTMAETATGHGTMVPAIGSHPHYQLAGQVDMSPTATT